MYTQELIENVRAKTPDTAPQTILAFLNMIIEFIYSRNLYGTRYIDPDTGLPPFLTTTAGTRRYRFPDTTYPVRVRHTTAVFTATNRERAYNSRSGWPLMRFMDLEYYKVPITSIQRTGANIPEIIFEEDPGATTDRYYHLFYHMPPVFSISEQSVQIPLPISCHFNLTPAILELISNEEYGDKSAFEYIKKVIAKDCWREMNRSPKTHGQITVQPEYREYPNLGVY